MKPANIKNTMKPANNKKTMKPAIYLIIIIVLLSQGCSENGDDSVSSLTPEQKQIQTHILDLQETSYDLFEQYIEEMDTTIAIDSLVKIIKEDTEVDSVVSNNQGILIKYKSGIWGGLFIDSEMNPEIQDVDLQSDLDIYGLKSTKQPDIAANIDAAVPSNKKVRILCTVYDEFYHHKAKLYDSLQKFFPKAGYQVVQFDKNDEVTVEKMKNIDDAGIVIIDTHGWAVSYSKDDGIDEIFISTGEEINDQTTANYWSDLKAHDILQATSRDGTWYYIRPDLFADYDKFKDDSTLFFGAFCYSGLGNWKYILVDICAAGGYFSIDWSVLASTCSDWTYSLFYHLTDTSKMKPMSCLDWTDSDLIKKYYYSEKHEIDISISYYYLYDIALWEKEGAEYDVNFWLQNISGNFKFTDPWDTISYFDKEVDLASTDEITGYLEGNRFTAVWEDVTVPVTGAASKGTADITLSSDLSSVTTFSIEITREDGDWTYYYDVSGSNIPGIPSIRRYSLDGTAACGNIIFNHYYNLEDNNGLWQNEMESFHCNDGTGGIAKSYIEFHLKPAE